MNDLEYASDGEDGDLLAEADYYGKNDFKPLSCPKVVCVFIVCIILSPLILLFVIFAVAFALCFPLSPAQAGALKIFTFEPLYKAPGAKLKLKASGPDTSDIIIPDEFVDSNGLLNCCGGTGVSLRKSIEFTVEEHIRSGPYGAKVASDTNVDEPQYHLNGGTFSWDPTYQERWTSSARYCTWPAIYCWSSYLPEGMGCSGLSQAGDLEEAPEVLGYIDFFEIGNPKFYETDRIVEVGGGTVNCPEITPENEGKIFARYHYQKTNEFGNHPNDFSVPDAYIFKGKTVKDAQFKILHRYRLMKPDACKY